MSETIEERAEQLGASIWNGYFTTEDERRDGLEVWRRVDRNIREGLQQAGDAGPSTERRLRRLPISTPVAQSAARGRDGGGSTGGGR